MIYFLGGMEPYLSEVLLPLFEEVRDGEATLVVSVVTEAELLVRPLRLGAGRDVERIEDLLSEDGVEVVDVDRRIARTAARLRETNGLALADAMIVATAIESGCDGMIGNDRAWARREIGLPYVLLDEAIEQAPARRRR